MWQLVDAVHARTVFQSLAWIIERIKNIDGHVDSWVDIQDQDQIHNCERCAPTPPCLIWKKFDRKVKAVEDQSQAGAYEQALKHRPSAFVTQLKFDEETGMGNVRIGVNVPSLVHRAVSRLPTEHRPEAPHLSWKLTTDYTPPAKLHLPKFRLSGNKHDPEHAQPRHFRIPLRPEQLRSLDWMIKQESRDAPAFIEEEISEAVLEPLSWRAEGRAQRPVHVRGGVLADEVGYGKTAITLGLIDSAPPTDADAPSSDIARGRIPVKGTLVVVPPHLTRQWASEVQKFCGKKFEVVVISTAANLNSLTIENIQDADIVVVASNLFKSSVYLANLEAFSTAGTLPTQEGRYFNARLKQALSALGSQVELLQKDGATAVADKIEEAEKNGE
jgi:SNF2-related domain